MQLRKRFQTKCFKLTNKRWRCKFYSTGSIVSEWRRKIKTFSSNNNYRSLSDLERFKKSRGDLFSRKRTKTPFQSFNGLTMTVGRANQLAVAVNGIVRQKKYRDRSTMAQRKINRRFETHTLRRTNQCFNKINHFNASLSLRLLPRVKTSSLIKLELGRDLTDCVRIFHSYISDAFL